MNEPISPVPRPPGLLRALGFWSAAAVVAGSIIGSGIFIKPADIAASLPGFWAAMAVWVAVAFLTIGGALALAEPAAMLPHAGGPYVILTEAFGRPAGFLWAWAEVGINRAASVAALATVFAQCASDLMRSNLLMNAGWSPTGPAGLGFWQQQAAAGLVVIGLAWVNARGASWGGRVEVGLTGLKLLTLAGVFVLPLAAALAGNGTAVNPANLSEVPAQPGWSLAGLGAALVAVLWAYNGWGSLIPLAGEVRDPQRVLPRALAAGVGAAALAYVAANVAFALVLTQSDLQAIHAQQSPVLAPFTERLVGPAGGALANLALAVSVFGTLNASLMAGPRVIYAAARDGLAPRALAAVDPVSRAPARAVWALTVWSLLLMLAAAVAASAGWVGSNKGVFDRLTAYVIFGGVIFETLSVAAVFALRRSRPDAPRPYLCPGYPWLPALYIVAMIGVMLSMVAGNPDEVVAGTIYLAVGAVVYALITRRRSTRPTDTTR